jgi:hypothetical protein
MGGERNGRGMAWEWNGMGAAWHGSGKAWARHGMCELAVTIQFMHLVGGCYLWSVLVISVGTVRWYIAVKPET